MKKRLFDLIAIFCVTTGTFSSALAAPVVRQGSGANSAGLQTIVDTFRNALGGPLNPNNGQSFTTGRREVNWDGVRRREDGETRRPGDRRRGDRRQETRDKRHERDVSSPASASPRPRV